MHMRTWPGASDCGLFGLENRTARCLATACPALAWDIRVQSDTGHDHSFSHMIIDRNPLPAAWLFATQTPEVLRVVQRNNIKHMSGRANSKALCHGMHVLERASLQPSNPPANKDEEVESSLSAQSLQHLCCTLLVRLEKRKRKYCFHSQELL